jgi:predicted PurR-regulated permease PerM
VLELTNGRIDTISLFTILSSEADVTAELSTTQKRLGTALFYGILFILAYLVYLVFQPFLAPLAWAIVMAVVAHPAYARLARKWGRTLAATVSTLGVTLIIIVPTILVTGAFIRQGVEAVQVVQQQIQSGHFAWVNDLWLRIQEKFPDANPSDLTTVIHRYADAGAAYLAARVGTVLRNTAVFLFDLTVIILSMFYFFRDGDAIVARLRQVLPFEKAHRDRMIDDARELIIGRTGVRSDWNSRSGFLGSNDGIFLAGSGRGLRAHMGSRRD